MKRIILISSLLLTAAGASAQYDYSSAARLDSIESALAEANANEKVRQLEERRQDVWRKGRFFNIGFTAGQTVNEISPKVNGSGFFLNKGTSYLWPKDGFGGIVKVGFDVKWFDLQFVSYKKREFLLAGSSDGISNVTDGWTVNPYYNSSTTTPSDPAEPVYGSVTHFGLFLGAFGIGPNVTVAPLASMDNAARSLRLSLYFHYQPGAYLNLYVPKDAGSYDYSDWDGCTAAYLGMWEFGGRIAWKNIGIGVEGRWGSTKLDNSTVAWRNYSNGYGNEIGFDLDRIGQGKYTRKFGETRIYLYLNF